VEPIKVAEPLSNRVRIKH